jgi:class 3 adenylate cyclase
VCELLEGKCAGISVSIGARVASNAGPSEVLVTQTVRDLVAGSGFAFEDVGQYELKGVSTVGGSCALCRSRGDERATPKFQFPAAAESESARLAEVSSEQS